MPKTFFKSSIATGQFPAIIPLASLDGNIGFKIDGEAPGDWSAGITPARDVNGDGWDDLLIGGRRYNNSVGRSYVVFGGPKVGDSGIISLSNLDGTNGFKLDGEMVGDQSGYAVAPSGDINGDAYADLLVSSPGYNFSTGRCYVVFGGPQVGSEGLILLADLDGVSGFKIEGEALGDFTGQSINAAGDVNVDGYDDFLIGGIGHNNSTGRCYVVFGKPNIGGDGLLLLSSLNGANGFKLDGEASGDRSGYTLSAAGDVNGDGWNDWIIGSDGHNNYTGRSYVIYGGSNVGDSGLLPLVSLNGTNGFKIDGELVNDRAGIVSFMPVKDMNDDEWMDIFIGGYNHNNTGRSYLMFGGATVGDSGLLSLSSLNGVNGFKLDGEEDYDASGGSISAAGDINGDGWMDLLISTLGSNNDFGRAYLVLGSPRIGSSGLLPLSSLNGVNGFKLDVETIGEHIIGVSAAGDINGDACPDFVIGSFNHNNDTGRSYVIFGDIPPVLVNNSLQLSSGAAITLDSTYLAAYDRNHDNSTLVFEPTSVSHGQFEWVAQPGIPLTNFTQQQIKEGDIQFVHDGTLVPPAYQITVRSTGIAWTGPQAAKINFADAPISQFPAVISLADLDGQIGFKIDGETPGDESGFSMTASDINGDGIADILLGAMQFLHPDNAPGAGLGYVIFGGSKVGRSGYLNLSTLNGENGFKLLGEVEGDSCGVSISGGDINADGYSDLLIGADTASPSEETSGAGRSYVVFGGPNTGKAGFIALSTLNGTNGFKLDGETTGDVSGASVKIAGDINGDGYVDWLIGAITYNSSVGRSYAVFGGAGIGSNGLIPLASLTGSNGFKLDGERSGDSSGQTVNAEDINKDGFVDILIYANGHDNETSHSYVIFGGAQIGESGLLPLSSLNGKNGFELIGEVADEGEVCCSLQGISSVDINGDGYSDLLLGNRFYGNNTGRSYVIFGSADLGSADGVSLSGLNGANGFKLDGETAGDLSGSTITGAGDIDGDGLADLLIGAYQYNSGTGRSYVIFGNTEIGSNGLLPLSTLNGVNGFKLDGEASGDVSGFALSATADINADGVTDILVGACLHNNATGRSYVIFGDIPPVLVYNHLSPVQNGRVNLTSQDLAAYDLNHANSSLVFIPSNIAYGQFETAINPGIALTNFTQQQIWDDEIQFVHNGGTELPAYDITVRSAGIAWTGPAIANVSIAGLWITTNQLVINQGQNVSLTADDLSAVNGGSQESSLRFLIDSVQQGKFVFNADPAQEITMFTQQDIADQQVLFVHNNSTTAPVYTLSVTDGTTTTAPISGAIDFDVTPVLEINQLIINQGQVITLNASNLQATHDGSESPTLSFLISDLQHGNFEFISAPGQSILNFFQQNITDGVVRFVHDQSQNAPAYAVAVSDGRALSVPQAAEIDFDATPVLVNNYLKIGQGQTIRITANNLNATQLSGDDSVLTFIITSPEHGFFNFITAPTQSVSVIPQQNITDDQVQFTHDDSAQPPSYNVSVTDSRASSVSEVAVIDFDPLPILVHNAITIGQNQTLILTTEQLLATQYGVAGSDLLFHITNLTHGSFLISGMTEEVNITFAQQEIADGAVSFVHDGAFSAPSYAVSVDDGQLQTDPAACNVTFYPKPVFTTNQLFSQVGKPTLLTTDNVCAGACTETTADDLLFIVQDTLQYGQFEWVSDPGKPITNFSQKQVKQSQVQFMPKGTPVAPSYALIAFDPQSQLSSDMSVGDTVLLITNDWPINQNETLRLSPQVLNATGSTGEDDDILYTPITDAVTHGYFALSATPDYAVPSFKQSQIRQNQVIFIPDGSTSAPTAILTITPSAINTAHGSFSCNVDFATSPILEHAFLKISPPDNVLLTGTNLQASDTRVSAGDLIFEVSNVKNNHFAYTSDWNTPIYNFTQQDVLDRQIYFIAFSTEPPAFDVSVWNGRLYCQGCPQSAEVVAPEVGSASLLSNWWMLALTGLALPVGRWGLEKGLKRYFGQSEQNELDQQVTTAILSQLWIGVCSIITRSQYKEYVKAVGEVIDEIKKISSSPLDLRREFKNAGLGYREGVITVIASVTKEELLKDRACSSTGYSRFFRSFCSSEATPGMIRGKALLIAKRSQTLLSGAERVDRRVSGAELDEMKEPLLNASIQERRLSGEVVAP